MTYTTLHRKKKKNTSVLLIAQNAIAKRRLLRLLRSKSKQTVAECYRYREPCCHVSSKRIYMKKKEDTDTRYVPSDDV